MRKRSKQYSTLEELYVDNRKLVFAILADIEGITDDEPLKEDLSSAIWVRIFEREEKFLSMEKRWVKNYIRVMVYNLSKDYLNKEKRRQETLKTALFMIGELTEKTVEDELFTEDDEIYLEEACRKLKDKDRLFIRMRFEYRMKAKEVGELLEMSEGAVRVKQLRILRKLKREIIKIKEEKQQ